MHIVWSARKWCFLATSWLYRIEIFVFNFWLIKLKWYFTIEFSWPCWITRISMLFWVQMIDMVSAIEELSGLTSKELSEMLKESDSFVLQSKAEDGSPKQVFILECLHMFQCPFPWHMFFIVGGHGKTCVLTSSSSPCCMFRAWARLGSGVCASWCALFAQFVWVSIPAY